MMPAICYILYIDYSYSYEYNERMTLVVTKKKMAHDRSNNTL